MLRRVNRSLSDVRSDIQRRIQLNIFEFLGLPKHHRATGKVTQLVKNLAEVPESRKKSVYRCQIKYDGVCTLAVVHKGKIALFSRTGKAFTNCGRVVDMLSGLNLPDGVYMGELYCPSTSLEVLSGIVNPNRTKPLDAAQGELLASFKFCVFDCVNIREFSQGKSESSYISRYVQLIEVFIQAAQTNDLVGVHVIDSYPCDSLDQAYEIAEDMIEAGHEGIVIVDDLAGWVAGHKGHHKMKIVRGVDYDLLCVGVEQGTGKYAGKVANLVFRWKGGEFIKCMLGRGWTHNDASDMYKYYLDGINSPVGQIFQVYALQESSKGKLRLPKVGEHRHDKDEADV